MTKILSLTKIGYCHYTEENKSVTSRECGKYTAHMLSKTHMRKGTASPLKPRK